VWFVVCVYVCVVCGGGVVGGLWCVVGGVVVVWCGVRGGARVMLLG
jgi:hypothetical protein